MKPRLRILAIKVYPVARNTALIYGVLGLVQLFIFAFSGEKRLALPIGILSPLFWLGVNISLPTSGNVFASIVLAAMALVCYMITGWLTGAAAVVLFNIAARQSAGIEADFLYDYSLKQSTTEDTQPPTLKADAEESGD